MTIKYRPLPHDPSQSKPFLDAALALRQAGENAEALKLLRKALTLNKDDVKAHVLAGLIHQQMEEPEKAEAYFRKAMQLKPDDPDALKSIGLFLVSQGREAEALDVIDRYVRSGKWDDQPMLETILSLADKLERQDLATALLKEAWEWTLSPEIGLLYVQQLRRTEKYAEAVRNVSMIDTVGEFIVGG